eukprot:4727387-Pyramimonas_sp.AAC.1
MRQLKDDYAAYAKISDATLNQAQQRHDDNPRPTKTCTNIEQELIQQRQHTPSPHGNHSTSPRAQYTQLNQYSQQQEPLHPLEPATASPRTKDDATRVDTLLKKSTS